MSGTFTTGAYRGTTPDGFVKTDILFILGLYVTWDNTLTTQHPAFVYQPSPSDNNTRAYILYGSDLRNSDHIRLLVDGTYRWFELWIKI